LNTKDIRVIFLQSEAKNLTSSIFNAMRDPSSPSAPQDDSPKEFFRSLLNPVRAGLVSRPENWSRPAGSSSNEYAGRSADEQTGRCGLIVDRVRMPSDPRARI
jgi:hypothetical protein